MTIQEALNTHDMEEIIDRMTLYARARMKIIDIKRLEGKTADDFVAEVLMKVVNDERDWNKARCSFLEFLFGSLRSHISNFFSTLKYHYTSEPDEGGTTQVSEDVTELKEMAIQALIDEGANSEELDVFNCWADGLTKPAAIAQELQINVEEIYNTTKRLSRKIPVLKSKMKSQL